MTTGHRVGRLIKPDFIPEEEIWIKIGGDKGGSTMKVNFQILNCPNPNSPVNTCVFALFEAPDSVTNLHLALDRYRDQVDELKSLTWRYLNHFRHTYLTITKTIKKHSWKGVHHEGSPFWRLHVPVPDLWAVWSQW